MLILPKGRGLTKAQIHSEMRRMLADENDLHTSLALYFFAIPRAGEGGKDKHGVPISTTWYVEGSELPPHVGSYSVGCRV